MTAVNLANIANINDHLAKLLCGKISLTLIDVYVKDPNFAKPESLGLKNFVPTYKGTLKNFASKCYEW